MLSFRSHFSHIIFRVCQQLKQKIAHLLPKLELQARRIALLRHTFLVLTPPINSQHQYWYQSHHITMGAAGSTPTPESFFAFQVVQFEYALLKGSENISDLNQHLESLFIKAQTEFALESPLLCTEPSCLLIKMKTTFKSPEEAKSITRQQISESLGAREKSKPKVVDSDYSKGFSGSAADTKAEKEFEKMWERWTMIVMIMLFAFSTAYSTAICYMILLWYVHVHEHVYTGIASCIYRRYMMICHVMT